MTEKSTAGVPGRWQVTLGEAREAPIPPGSRSPLLMEHGSMRLRYYAPRGTDQQTPHEQDELYIVASGTGTVVREGARRSFGPQDVLFVPAGTEHRFEDFTDDFGAWVVFYSPDGGEAA